MKKLLLVISIFIYMPALADDLDRQAEAAEMLGLSQDQKALQQLAVLEAKYRGTRLEAQIQVNKADLYLRQARSSRILDYVVGQKSSGAKSAKENTALQMALGVLLKVEKNFRKYAGMDRVKLRIARIYEKIKKPIDAQKYYNKIIHDHKNSSLFVEAQLSLGDNLFHQKKFSEAQSLYNVVAEIEGPYQSQATYMKAWCQYNLYHPNQGLLSLKKVIGDGDIISTLVSEALNDVPLFFAEQGIPSEAKTILNDVVGERYLPQVLNELSEIYRRYNRKRDADLIDRDITLLGLEGRETLFSFRRRVEYSLEAKDYMQAKERSLEFVKYCDDRIKSCGSQKNLLIGEWLKQAIKTYEKKPSSELAQFIIESFKLSQDPKLRREHAAFLFSQKKFAESYQIYKQVFSDESVTEDLFGALASLDRTISTNPTDEQYKEYKVLAQQFLRRESTPRSRQVEVRLALLASKVEDHTVAQTLTRKLAGSEKLDSNDKKIIDKLSEQSQFKHALEIAESRPKEALQIFTTLTASVDDRELADESRLNALIICRKLERWDEGKTHIKTLKSQEAFRKQLLTEMKVWAWEFDRRMMWTELDQMFGELQELDKSNRDEWKEKQKVLAQTLNQTPPETLEKATGILQNIKKAKVEDLEKILGQIKILQSVVKTVSTLQDPVWTVRANQMLAEGFDHIASLVASFPDESVAAQATGFEQQASVIRGDIEKVTTQFLPDGPSEQMSVDEVMVVEFNPGEKTFTARAFPKKINKIRAGSCEAPSLENTRNLLVSLAACVAQKNWKTVESLAFSLARIEPELPWAPYYMSLAAESADNIHLSRWYLQRAKGLKVNNVFDYQTARLRKNLLNGRGV